MKIPLLASLLCSLSPIAFGTVVTLAPSAQVVTSTGLGAGPTGLGTHRLTWGACNYDGTNTTCTVSGTYTGLGSGGTYSFVLTYPGNGPSPLTTTSNSIGSDLVTFSLSAGTFVETLTPTNGNPVRIYDLNFGVFFSPQTDSCTGTPTCSVGAVGTIAGSTIKGPVNGTVDPTPVITPGGVITAGQFGAFAAIAPATWIEIYGLNLANVQSLGWQNAFAGAQAPSALGGTTVTVGGKAAFIDIVTPEQVNVQVPSGIALGPQPVVVTTFGGSSVAATVTVNATQPGLLAPPLFKLAAGQYVAALFPDNQTYVLPPNSGTGIKTNRAKPKDVVQMYGIGFGAVTPDISAGVIVQQANNLSGFTATVGGVPATINFAGLVNGLLGLYQFNVVIPDGLPANDATPFVFKLNGTPGQQSLLLAIGN